MQVKEIDIDTGKIEGYGICKKKKNLISTTPTNSTWSILQEQNAFRICYICILLINKFPFSLWTLDFELLQKKLLK